MKSTLFQEFITITRLLNKKSITPLLMGSLGLEFVTGQSWQPRDIDIHVPGDPRGWEAPDEDRIYSFDRIQEVMESLGYTLVDRHEHEFIKNDLAVEFGCLDTLPAFANVPLEDLTLEDVDGANFYVPNTRQFLQIYQASSKDSYRNDQNNDKDFEKIAFLKRISNN